MGLFCVDENVVGGNRGKVGTGLFNLVCLFGDCFVFMKMLLVEIVVRWERCFSTWDFMLVLFGVDENVFIGNRGEVGKGLFNLGCLW